ncbi:hypothetical protein R5O87_19280 [Arthrobacter globiformis]|uniref:hypothetical protein n=1 Tax=Arthrobacter globiformis TaxID=1665 RepID=UPI00397806B4
MATSRSFDGLRAVSCGYAGFSITGDRNTVQNSSASNNAAGIKIGNGSDFGKYTGNDNEVTANTISGSAAASFDFVVDGGAIEIFNGNRNNVHHNIALDDNSFSELGRSTGTADGNTYRYNLVRSTCGSLCAQAVVCHAQCPSSTVIRGNVLVGVKISLWINGSGWTEKEKVFTGPVNVTPSPTSRRVPSVSFVTTGTDFHLTANSAAIDLTTSSSSSLDLDDRPVPQDGNCNGTATATPEPTNSTRPTAEN